MNIDNKLLFDRHISSVCKKISSQLNVMLRFRKLISSATLVINCTRPLSYHVFTIVHRCGISVAREMLLK